MPHTGGAPKRSSKRLQERFGQRDLRQQDQDLPRLPQRLRDGFEIGFGLARAGTPSSRKGANPPFLDGATNRGGFVLPEAQFGHREIGVGARVGPVESTSIGSKRLG